MDTAADTTADTTPLKGVSACPAVRRELENLGALLMPRPKEHATSRDLGRIEEMIANGGYSTAQALTEVGFSAANGRKARRTDPKIAEAIARGMARQETALVNALFETAMNAKHPKAVTAAIFLLKARHKYIDQPKSEPPESRVEITFQIPAALKPEQYRELVEVTPPKALKQAGMESDG